MKSFIKNFLALLFGTTVTFILLEVSLRFYNPFGFRLKGDRIILEANTSRTFKNTHIKSLEAEIIHSKNALGFRGPALPADRTGWTTIFAVGGSTTECYYISDGKDWPSLVSDKLNKKQQNIWMNNAGLDGHSTYGHQILLNDYLLSLKPDMLLFLIGCNDVGRADLGKFDDRVLHKRNKTWKNYFINNSETVNLIANLRRGWMARTKGLVHHQVDLNDFEMVKELDTLQTQKEVQRHQQYQKDFAKRLQSLIKLAKTNNSQPVFITQPTLVGNGIDPIIQIDLAKIQYGHRLGGQTYWAILESYNETTRQVAKAENILLIDLAKQMPKSSAYFYDKIHFTNAGAEMVAEIVADELKGIKDGGDF